MTAHLLAVCQSIIPPSPLGTARQDSPPTQVLVGRGRQRRSGGRQAGSHSIFHFPFYHHHQHFHYHHNRQQRAYSTSKVHLQRLQLQIIASSLYSSPRKAPRSGTCLLGPSYHVTFNLTCSTMLVHLMKTSSILSFLAACTLVTAQESTENAQPTSSAPPDPSPYPTATIFLPGSLHELPGNGMHLAASVITAVSLVDCILHINWDLNS